MAEAIEDRDLRDERIYRDGDAELPVALPLELMVRDRDTIAELCSYPDGEGRDEFALSALRIGVLALRQARGRIDGDLVRRESDRWLENLSGQLKQHASQVQADVAEALKEYFAPGSGRFQERVERLIKQDGELETVLRRQIGGQDSELVKTLAAHMGHGSPLLKMLNPAESDGILAALRTTVEKQLGEQRQHVLKEFSLDNKDGALARLVVELTTQHGRLTQELEEKLDEVVKEFSLDEENSALSRLVSNVARAQRTITDEFSLDNDKSALARLKGELTTLLDAQAKTAQTFQEEVKVALGKMTVRREEAARSTRHGIAFEAAVCEFIAHEAQRICDIATSTGATPGLISRCKTGDAVIELGPDAAAPGARIVVEAKEHAGYCLADARQEIEEARKNRDAQIGLFVFSRKTMPAELTGITRLGNDVFLAWDAEDAQTDLLLSAGLSLARALCIRATKQNAAQTADFQAMDVAILEVEKQCGKLQDIERLATTIKNNGENILKHVEQMRKSLVRQIDTLREKTADLKQAGAAGEPSAIA